VKNFTLANGTLLLRYVTKEHGPDDCTTMATGWGEKIHEYDNHITAEVEGTSGGPLIQPFYSSRIT